jgi:DNA-binding response OmpR family regulator
MRIDALAERLDPKTFFQYFDVRIDCKNRIANVKEQRTHLTPTEREVIEALIDNR